MAGVLAKLAEPPGWVELLEVAGKELPRAGEGSREHGAGEAGK
jgi:hypothetical protein